MKPYLYGLLAFTLVATSCSTTLKPRTLDSTGRFPTETKISAEGLKVVTPFLDKYKALAYIKTDAKGKQYNDFFVESFKSMGTFTKVVQKEDLESLVVEKKLMDKVTNISDLIGLNQLQKQIGPFLVIEPYAEFKGRFQFFAHLKAIDPESGQTVLLLEQTAVNWSGLDDPLFFPLLNAFLQWSKGESISTAPKSK